MRGGGEGGDATGEGEGVGHILRRIGAASLAIIETDATHTVMAIEGVRKGVCFH